MTFVHGKTPGRLQANSNITPLYYTGSIDTEFMSSCCTPSSDKNYFIKDTITLIGSVVLTEKWPSVLEMFRGKQ